MAKILDWTHMSETSNSINVWHSLTNGFWYYPEQSKIDVAGTINLQGKEVKKEMRCLYHVVVVDYKKDNILEDDLYIAESPEKAKIKALAQFVDDYDIDDLDVVCNKLGEVRKEEKPQKVQVVNE